MHVSAWQDLTCDTCDVQMECQPQLNLVEGVVPAPGPMELQNVLCEKL